MPLECRGQKAGYSNYDFFDYLILFNLLLYDNQPFTQVVIIIKYIYFVRI